MVKPLNEYLLKLGEGSIPQISFAKYEDEIQLPISVARNMDENELIKKVYPDLNLNYNNVEFMTSRALLTTKNNGVDRINGITANLFPGSFKTYLLKHIGRLCQM